jgi:hypothetical protein
MKPFGPEDRARRRLARLQSFQKIADAFATSTALPGNAPVVDRKRLPQEAIRLVSDFLATLVWPMMPQLVYKGVRTAARDEDTPVEDADAQVLIAAKITTVSGVRREVEVPVVVRNGKLLEPSVMMVDGVPRIIAQSLVDELTRGGTFRQSVDPRGNIYGPPMDREAHEHYLEQGDEFKVRDRVSRGLYSVGMRCCSACGIEKPATTEFFHQKRGGLASRCKPCRSTARPETAERRRLADAGLKQCGRCGEAKPATTEHFWVDARRGLQGYCKPCTTAAADEWRRAHPDQRREAARAWEAQNIEKRRVQDRARYEASPERKLTTNREWIKKHPEAAKARAAAYRARVLAAPGTHSAEDLRRIYDAQQGECFYCGIALDGAYHADHMTPPKRGGTNWPQNMCCACGPCNMSKRDMTANEFLAYRTSRKAQLDPESQNILQQLVDLGPWSQSSPGATIEPELLQPLLQAGLVEQQGQSITITDAGRAALGKTAQSYEPQQPCDCPAQPLHDVREHCEQCGAFGGCDCAAWDYENPDAVREGQAGEAKCGNCGHGTSMHADGGSGACVQVAWKASPCGCQQFVPADEARTIPANKWRPEIVRGLTAQEQGTHITDDFNTALCGQQIVPGTMTYVHREVYEGADEPKARFGFCPQCVSTVSAEPSHLARRAQEQPEISPCCQAPVTSVERGDGSAIDWVCSECFKEVGPPTEQEGIPVRCVYCGYETRSALGGGPCPECGEDLQPKEARRAQKYDPGARVKVDGKPARVVEQVHEPSESASWDGTYRVEWQNGETDVVPESKISYDEERQTLRHKEGQVGTTECSCPECDGRAVIGDPSSPIPELHGPTLGYCRECWDAGCPDADSTSCLRHKEAQNATCEAQVDTCGCASPNCSHGGSDNLRGQPCPNDAESPSKLCYDCESFSYQRPRAKESQQDPTTEFDQGGGHRVCPQCKSTTVNTEWIDDNTFALVCLDCGAQVPTRVAHQVTCRDCNTSFVSGESCPGCGSSGAGDLRGMPDTRPTMVGRKGQVLGKDQLPVCDDCDKPATRHVGGYWLCDEHAARREQRASLPGIGLGARVLQAGRAGQVVDVQFDGTIGGQLALVAWHDGGEDYFTAEDFRSGLVALAMRRRAFYVKCDIMVGDQKGRFDVYPPSYGAPDVRDVLTDYDPADGPIKIYRAEGKTDGPMPSGSTFTANSIEEANAILLQIQQTVEEPGGPSGDDPDAESYRPFTSGRAAQGQDDCHLCRQQPATQMMGDGSSSVARLCDACVEQMANEYGGDYPEDEQEFRRQLRPIGARQAAHRVGVRVRVRSLRVMPFGGKPGTVPEGETPWKCEHPVGTILAVASADDDRVLLECPHGHQVGVSHREAANFIEAAHDEDGQPAQHNEERKQDDFSAGDTVAFATSFRNRTRGGPSYLIDSGTSAEVVRDVFEDGTRFEVRLSDGQLAIVPRETLRSARRTAQADEQTKRRIRQMVMQDISEDRESTEARIFGDAETRGFSRADVEAVIDEMVGAGEIVSTVIDAQNTGSGFVPALKKAQQAVVAQQDYPAWCAYCGEDAGASGRPDQVDLPSGRKVSLCGRHNRQSLDRYHDGGSAQFIQSVDAMPDSFWQTSRTAQSDWWDKMSPEQQQQYVEQHPGTKMQPGGGEPKQPGTPQQPAQPKAPKPSAPKEHGVTRDGVSFESPSVGSKVQVEDASGLMGARGVQPPAGSKGEVTSMKGPTHWGETWATIRWDNGQEDQYLVDPGHGGSGTSFAVDDVAAGRQKSQQGRISIVGHRRTAATPRVDQVLREVQGLKDDGYSDLDVMLSVFDKYGEIAEAVMNAAKEKGILDV